MVKKKKLKRPCKTCKNEQCSQAGNTLGERFICTSYVSQEDLENKKKTEEYLKEIKESLENFDTGLGGFPFF